MVHHACGPRAPGDVPRIGGRIQTSTQLSHCSEIAPMVEKNKRQEAIDAIRTTPSKLRLNSHRVSLIAVDTSKESNGGVFRAGDRLAGKAARQSANCL
jgi:hypothetical protein